MAEYHCREERELMDLEAELEQLQAQRVAIGKRTTEINKTIRKVRETHREYGAMLIAQQLLSQQQNGEVLSFESAAAKVRKEAATKYHSFCVEIAILEYQNTENPSKKIGQEDVRGMGATNPGTQVDFSSPISPSENKEISHEVDDVDEG